MASYSLSERKKILQNRLTGESIKDLSARSGVSTTSLYQWIKDYQSEFAPINILDRPLVNAPILIGYGDFTIELPHNTDVSYIRSILGC